MKCRFGLWLLLVGGFFAGLQPAQAAESKFGVLAFYTGQDELPHLSFVCEANRWFQALGLKTNFSYEAASDWRWLNLSSLAEYQVVVFLDTRPADPAPRKAFQQYMEHRGEWLGFHFATFALYDSRFPQNWVWSHEKLFGGRR